ncbi:MAG: ABC transporter permease [Acidimicrobiales bacterium]
MISRVVAQTRVELALTARRGESVLLSLGIPVLFLVFFSTVDVIAPPVQFRHRVDFLAPGILALAVMSSAMVGLGIATGFERQYGVLKRLGSTPLGRAGLLGAKTAAMLAVEIVQLVVLVGVALALGWRPHGSVGAAVAGAVLATIAFAGLGLLMAGTLRGEVVLGAANGLYLVLLLLGGMVVPLSRLPSGVRAVARALPAAALSDVLHGALVVGNGAAVSIPGRAWAVLAAWAVAAPVAAALTFRWE